ncbi:hypothetical protein FNV43_RR15929 [Rhamnella rubrinervis]|uniref:Uncharacterized protein n=1 Tax=Rhamnella rubrinervis TaxID=2594499 RepID=A0A8K0E7H8_9ROSA|nr:hypothetical protein FNV43_RR15929 [Rhamnella rubrinervis]
MGKSSSSHKKKRSKNPSQVRMKKRSKSRSRRYESKKVRHRHDSLSFSEDDDSKSPMSFSSYSSSSEDNHRSKRARSRTRKDTISKKKRAQRHSCSHKISEDSPHVRKRKRLKRNHDYKSKKKTHPKKKPRRDASVSSTDGSISSHEIEFKRRRSRCGKEEIDERKYKKVKGRSEMSRYRSRSHSLSSQYSESSDYRTYEKVLAGNNFRRLRSVITVTEKDNEGREFNTDEHKEEVIYFHDDYPSCRSNDSNDGGSKREGDHHSHFGSEEKMRLEKEEGDEAVVSNVKISKLENCAKICDRYGDDLYNESTLNRDELGIIDSSSGRMSEVSGVIGSLNGDDLESLLRQRALENLRKFQGGLQLSAKTAANQKEKDYSDVKQSSPAKAESVQNKSLEEDSTRVFGAKSSKEDDAGVVGSNRTQSVKLISMPRVNKDATHSSQNDEKIPDGNTGNNETIYAKQNIKYPTDQLAVSGNNSEIVKSVGSVQPKFVTPALRRHSSIAQSTLKQAHVSSKPPGGKLVVTESSLDEDAAVTAPTVTESSNKNSLDINNACGSGGPEPSSNLSSSSGDNRSDTMQNEVKEGSQFEQKTMSVMRGGEMVQVSYKVYIPKNLLHWLGGN